MFLNILGFGYYRVDYERNKIYDRYNKEMYTKLIDGISYVYIKKNGKMTYYPKCKLIYLTSIFNGTDKPDDSIPGFKYYCKNNNVYITDNINMSRLYNLTNHNNGIPDIFIGRSCPIVDDIDYVNDYKNGIIYVKNINDHVSIDTSGIVYCYINNKRLDISAGGGIRIVSSKYVNNGKTIKVSRLLGTTFLNATDAPHSIYYVNTKMYHKDNISNIIVRTPRKPYRYKRDNVPKYIVVDKKYPTLYAAAKDLLDTGFIKNRSIGSVYSTLKRRLHNEVRYERFPYTVAKIAE